MMMLLFIWKYQFVMCISIKMSFIAGMPINITYWTNDKKLGWLTNLIKPMLDKIFTPVSPPSMEDLQIRVNLGQDVHYLTVPPTKKGTVVDMNIEGKYCHLNTQTHLLSVNVFKIYLIFENIFEYLHICVYSSISCG